MTSTDDSSWYSSLKKLEIEILGKEGVKEENGSVNHRPAETGLFSAMMSVFSSSFSLNGRSGVSSSSSSSRYREIDHLACRIFECAELTLEECDASSAASIMDVIGYYLHTGGVQEMERRLKTYTALFVFCEREIVVNGCIHARLKEPRSDVACGGCSLYSLIESFAEKAALFVVLHSNKDEDGEVGEVGGEHGGGSDESVACARIALRLRQRLSTVGDADIENTQSQRMASESETPSEGGDDRAARYNELMRPLCFALEDGVAEHNHFFRTNKDAASLHVPNPRLRNNRLRKELADLAANLPLYPCPILVRVDSNRNDMLIAVIVGSPGTPYEGGVFEFHVFIGPDFPSSPPSVQFMTTDSGRKRFNPNLYKSGKVCLSLLGTWSGPGWDPEHSSILQVLVSIQSLILNSEPYFNEPGLAALQGTNAGTEASLNYNNHIREATLRVATLRASLYPPICLTGALKQHFSLMSGEYLQQLSAWEADLRTGWGQGKAGSSYTDSVTGIADDLAYRAREMDKVINTLRKRFSKMKAMA